MKSSSSIHRHPKVVRVVVPGFLCALFFVLCSPVQAEVTPEKLGQILLRGDYAGITNRFKPGVHAGIDYRARTPLPVRSPVSGTVLVADETNGHLAVLTEDGKVTWHFLHLSKLKVAVKARVVPGMQIAVSGDTGYKTARRVDPHLHVECRSGKRIEPAPETDTKTVLDPATQANVEVIRATIYGDGVVKGGRSAAYKLHIDGSDGSTTDFTTDRGTIWAVNNPRVATIDAKGKLTTKRVASNTLIAVSVSFKWNSKPLNVRRRILITK